IAKGRNDLGPDPNGVRLISASKWFFSIRIHRLVLLLSASRKHTLSSPLSGSESPPSHSTSSTTLKWLYQTTGRRPVRSSVHLFISPPGNPGPGGVWASRK